MMRKLLSLILALCLFLALPLPARASGMGEMAPYAQKLIQYYLHHQENADDVIWDILRQMEALDPYQAETWRNIMADWSWVNTDMPVYTEVLPDGLPDDDSLCIVVLGYALTEEGYMQEALIDRLVVALASSLKYPNAYVLVSGGQTSPVEGVTEAGRMADWLKKKGLSEDRLILDKQSLSTTANAVNSYKLLTGSYPQVDSIAVITSDYHVPWACSMFTTVSNYKSGYDKTKPLELAAVAVSDTGTTADTLLTQAWGISLIADIPFDENAKAPELYPVVKPTEPPTEPVQPTQAATSPQMQPKTETPDAAEASAEQKFPILPVLIAAAAAAGVYAFIPKKPKKKHRRARPKMDWSEPDS